MFSAPGQVDLVGWAEKGCGSARCCPTCQSEDPTKLGTYRSSGQLIKRFGSQCRLICKGVKAWHKPAATRPCKRHESAVTRQAFKPSPTAKSPRPFQEERDPATLKSLDQVERVRLSSDLRNANLAGGRRSSNGPFASRRRDLAHQS